MAVFRRRKSVKRETQSSWKLQGGTTDPRKGTSSGIDFLMVGRFVDPSTLGKSRGAFDEFQHRKSLSRKIYEIKPLTSFVRGCRMSCMTGDQIKKIRDQLGLTQAEFAMALEISAVTVNRWENDDPRYKPSDKEVRLIEALMEILEKTRNQGGTPLSEIRDALRVATVGGIVGAAATNQMLSLSTIGILAATRGLGWIGAIAGTGLAASLPFFKKLNQTNTNPENRK